MRVNEFAAYLRDGIGVRRGDRVTVHLPMVAELAVTMLACARLGVIHSVVFGGFSAQACADRIVDSGSSVLITSDGYWRAGKWIDHKEKADQACDLAVGEGHRVEKVLIWERHPGQYRSDHALVEGRDVVVDDVIGEFRGQRVEPEHMRADETLFLMYTSGSTGKPKAAQHSTGGYLAYVTAMSKLILDLKPTDVYWCMADIGWITGHSFIVYGPLSLGASSIIYEGVPNHPDAGRPWRIAERLDVNILHTSPTAIRLLRKDGPEEPKKYHYHFKLMVTVGEPIEPDVWRWYYNVVGQRESAIVDTWWQTENGGFLCSTVPALQPMKPGSAGPGVPGIHPVIYDNDGNEVPAGTGKGGNICIRNPWPGSMMGIWGNPDRYVDTYYARYCKNRDSKDWRDWPYFAGDGAMLASDGYFRILGRIDDVINVAGHRLGTKELESAALTVPGVAEAAVVATHDEIKGIMPELFVSLAPGVPPSERVGPTSDRRDRPGHRPDRQAAQGVARPRPAKDPLRQDHEEGARVCLEPDRGRGRHQPRQSGNRRADPRDGAGRAAWAPMTGRCRQARSVAGDRFPNGNDEFRRNSTVAGRTGASSVVSRITCRQPN